MVQTQVHPRKDSIYVDGRSLPKNVESLYFCLNKPKGYMCSNDPNGKKLVVDLFEDFMLAWVRRSTLFMFQILHVVRCIAVKVVRLCRFSVRL